MHKKSPQALDLGGLRGFKYRPHFVVLPRVNFAAEENGVINGTRTRDPRNHNPVL